MKLEKNLYGAKQVVKVRHDHCINTLQSISFVSSKYNLCLYYRKHVMFFFYVDDGIFISKKTKNVKTAITDLQKQASILMTKVQFLIT